MRPRRGRRAGSSATMPFARAFRALPAAGADGHHGYAGGLLEHTVGVATLCRETAQLHPRLRGDLLARRGAAARRRAHARARPRAGVSPDRGGTPARARPSRPAADRGAIRRLSMPRLAPSSSTRSPCTTTGRRRAPPRPPCSTTRTSSTPRPRPGPSGSSGSDDSRGTGARCGGALGHRRLLRRPRDPPGLGADRLFVVAARRPARASSSGSSISGAARPGRRARVRGGGGHRRRGRARLPLPRHGGRGDGHRGADLRHLAGRAARRLGRAWRLARGTPVGRDLLALVGIVLVVTRARRLSGAASPRASGWRWLQLSASDCLSSSSARRRRRALHGRSALRASARSRSSRSRSRGRAPCLASRGG